MTLQLQTHHARRTQAITSARDLEQYLGEVSILVQTNRDVVRTSSLAFDSREARLLIADMLNRASMDDLKRYAEL
ncbi:MAG: hypothetical protein CYPHOPRED_004807, partial [Cyphobasidiales sp. Tagirdzhanova-0007]